MEKLIQRLELRSAFFRESGAQLLLLAGVGLAAALRLKHPDAARGAAAAAMLVATSLVTLPARADATKKIDGLPAACLKAGDELAQLQCGTAHYKQLRIDAEARTAKATARKAEADARSAVADARNAAADKKIADAKKSDDEVASAEKCFGFLKAGIGSNKFKREAVLETAGGKVTVENACPTAARYGYERRASVGSPEIR